MVVAGGWPDGWLPEAQPEEADNTNYYLTLVADMQPLSAHGLLGNMN